MQAGRVIFMIFFLQALAGGGIFAHIPAVQSNLGLDEARLGIVLAAQPFGALFSLMVASSIVERFGTKPVLNFGIFLLALASWLFVSVDHAWAAFGSLALYGVSFSMTNVAMNVEADRIEVQSGVQVMNKCHGYWSIGLLFASLIAVLATRAGITPQMHLEVILGLTLLVLLFDVRKMQVSRARPHNAPSRRTILSFPSKALLGIVAFGLMAGITQGVAQNWSVIYMRDSFELPNWGNTVSIPVFLGFLTVGRFAGDRMQARFGKARVVDGLIAFTLLGILFLVFAPHYTVALTGFALLGLGVSIGYPVMITAAAQLQDSPASANVASAAMIMGLSILIVPPIMGALVAQFGVKSAFLALVPPAGLAFWVRDKVT